MSNLPDPMTQQQLLDDFGSEWNALMAVIEGVDDGALMTRTDAAGWNVRDHLANLSAWLQSVIVMVRDGEPQWAGLGVSEALFRNSNDDEINVELRQQAIHSSVGDIWTEFQRRHEVMIGLVKQLSDDQLLLPASAFSPESKDVAICYFIDGDGPYHYRQHREWIEKILAS